MDAFGDLVTNFGVGAGPTSGSPEPQETDPSKMGECLASR